MSEKAKKFEVELDELCNTGLRLVYAMQSEFETRAFMDVIENQMGEETAAKFVKGLPSFRDEYQTWYSKACAVIQQVLPHRLNDFVSYYEYTKTRKTISFDNYMIKDALQSLQISKPNGSTVTSSAAIPEMVQQVKILDAAKDALSSRLLDLSAIILADFFDSELDSAKGLMKAGHLRASGAICGVVIEKHLQSVCEAHDITIRKKDPTINVLNQALRDGETITVPQWRFIQHLADIRNLCDHAKGAEPTADQIADLTTGTEKIIKTVF